jgi:hypothetical protein
MLIRMDIGNRLIEGRKLAREQHVEKEKAKLGNLRAGNSGLMSTDGQFAGSCPRTAHLRQLGVEVDPPSPSTVIMFQVGIANEDIVHQDLLHTSSSEHEVILREEEIPIEWHTANGTKVTGRPDIVLCSRTMEIDERSGARVITKPELGIELKSVASVWTTRSVLIDGEPKLAHLVQAGHYAWKLNVPFRLVYKQYSIQAMPEFAHKFFPRVGEKGSEYLDYAKNGKPKSVRPFEIVYELVYRKGQLCYRREGTKSWTTTIVASADIERFYEFVSQMGTEKKLGPMPMTVNATGEEASYSNCDYCPLKPTCKAEKDYTKWLGAVKKVVASRLTEDKK